MQYGVDPSIDRSTDGSIDLQSDQIHRVLGNLVHAIGVDPSIDRSSRWIDQLGAG
jgi:hypothetical protein